MEHKANDEILMVEYLRGRLSNEDQARVEDRFLRDHEYLEHLKAIEEDLNDSYVFGELSRGEREEFEKRISASPEWQQRVEFARALAAIDIASFQTTGAADAEPESVFSRRSFLAFLRDQSLLSKIALATAATAVLVAGSWLLLETSRQRAELRQLQAERRQLEQRELELQQQTADARARADELARELERDRGQREQLEAELEKPAAPRRSIISFILVAGVGRAGEESTRLVVPQDARVVRLNLYLQGPTPYGSYRTELLTAAGKPVWSRDGLTMRQTRTGKAVALSLPADALAAGKYEMILRGVISKEKIEDVDYYYFSVVKP
jgi:anti-sigma-K factor RskA